MSWDISEKVSLGGNAQGIQIMGKLNGPADFMLDAERTHDLREFLAHEMAHVWQNSNEDNIRWFVEGGAELLSMRTMLLLEEQTKSGLAADLSEQIGPAMTALAKTSLLKAHLQGDPELNYSAGTLVMAAAEAASPADEKANHFFEIERAVTPCSTPESNMQHAKLKHASSFRLGMMSLGATESAVATIEFFIITQHEDLRSALLTLFNETGLDYQVENGHIIINPV